jgi:hypothetical protein
MFGLKDGLEEKSVPARAGEHTPPEHVVGLIHPVLALQLPICVYPLARVAFFSPCPVVWYYLVADKLSIC